MSLYCDASGFPVPTVTWSKLGDDGFMNRNTWLNFTNITRNEAGNYTCRAKNICGKDSSSVRILVFELVKSVVFRCDSSTRIVEKMMASLKTFLILLVNGKKNSLARFQVTCLPPLLSRRTDEPCQYVNFNYTMR